MRRAIVDETGRLLLGEEARCVGFKPGAVVEISLNITGSLLLRVADDDSQAIDAFARALPGKREHLAIGGTAG